MPTCLDDSLSVIYTHAMQSVISNSEPFDEVLFREGNLTVTSTRLEIKNKTYALKYISTITLDESHPPRDLALIVVVISAVAFIATLIYGGTDKLSGGAFQLALLGSLLTLMFGALVRWLIPSKYLLKLELVSGEAVQVDSKSSRFVQGVHTALSTSVALNRPPVERVTMDALPPSSYPHPPASTQRFL